MKQIVNKILKFGGLLMILDEYHQGKMEKFKKVFGEYFDEFDRVYDVFTQIELNFFNKMGEDARVAFGKNLEESFKKYDLKKNHKDTLLSLLEFMVFVESYHCIKNVKKNWKEIEKKGFDDKENRLFAIKILRYIAAVKDMKIADDFMNMVLSSENFHINFAAMVFLVKVKKKPKLLPELIEKFTKLGWNNKKKKFLRFMILNFVIELGKEIIIENISYLNPESYWFAKILFNLKVSKLVYESGEYFCKNTFDNTKVKIKIHKKGFQGFLESLLWF